MRPAVTGWVARWGNCSAPGSVSISSQVLWHTRAPSVRAKRDDGLAERIRNIHEKSHCTNGAPRVHAELKNEGGHVSQRRVVRLMARENLEGANRHRCSANGP